MKRLFLALIFGLGLIAAPAAYADVATFDDLLLAPGSYHNNSDFVSGGAYFHNAFDPLWNSWDGWAYSNMTDTTTAGWTNQYSAITGGGANGSANYGVAYDAGAWGGASPPFVSFNETTISGAYFTNTTYAYFAMRNGDTFVDAFDQGDWQKMIVTGIDAAGGYTSSTVELFLADYTSSDSADWYILDQWARVDMTGLGDIVGFEIDFAGSQVGLVPAYVAMDDLNAVPIPGAVWLMGSGVLTLVGIRRKKS